MFILKLPHVCLPKMEIELLQHASQKRIKKTRLLIETGLCTLNLVLILCKNYLSTLSASHFIKLSNRYNIDYLFG
jgi:hypothetical protein